MGNIFTLDNMRAEIEREFAPLQIEVDGKILTLRNLLRVPKKSRDTVYSLLDELSELNKNAEEAGSLAATEKTAQIALHIMPLVADDQELAKLMVSSIEDDLALTLRVFSSWMDSTQAGEAEGSRS